MKINGYEIGPGANLCGANLCDANLRGANLRGANLCGANLCDANLRDADLCDADLRGANLCDANLRDADLCDADLRGAYLRGADLCDANLRDANLRDADLRGAYLRGAYLRGAYLRDADLRDADLRGADLRDADLRGTKGLELFCILPEGDIVGWKKVSGVLVKLRIPETAARVNAYGSRKCRAEHAEVLDFADTLRRSVMSDGRHGPKTKYVKGETVRPDKFDPDPRVECSNGIHFFITREEAENWG